MTSNIAELKDHLSQYLRRVRAGETIWVKDRDRIIAKIEPVREASLEEEDLSWMAELVESGVVTPPREKMTKQELEAFLANPVKPRKKKIGGVAALLEEREGGR